MSIPTNIQIQLSCAACFDKRANAECKERNVDDIICTAKDAQPLKVVRTQGKCVIAINESTKEYKVLHMADCQDKTAANSKLNQVMKTVGKRVVK